MKNVVVVGLGYVGLPVAVLASQKGFKVTGVDNDSTKIDIINSGKSPFEDTSLNQSLANKPFSASTSYNLVSKADIVIIAVPTPVKQEMPDLSILKIATESVAKHLRPGSLLVIESTINPGVCDDVLIPLIEEVAGLKDGKDYFLAHCPERISPGDKWALKDINRVVGSNYKKGLNKAINFYSSLLDAEVKAMETVKEAEAVKVVENSFRDINIAFVNELAMSFDLMGINIENVIDGASTKPFGYMPFRPGPGVGGHCIPVDPHYLIEYARSFGFEHRFMQLAREINKNMPKFVVGITLETLRKKAINPQKATIALFGLSYKPNVDDLRESPALIILELLKQAGINVLIHDPHVKFDGNIKTLDKVLSHHIDAIVVATHHDKFKELTPTLLKDHDVSIIIDSRNMFRQQKAKFKKLGIVYRGVGQS